MVEVIELMIYEMFELDVYKRQQYVIVRRLPMICARLSSVIGTGSSTVLLFVS